METLSSVLQVNTKGAINFLELETNFREHFQMNLSEPSVKVCQDAYFFPANLACAETPSKLRKRVLLDFLV